MSRELWLLRHAKSDRNVEMDDFDRPLKKRGKKAALRLAVWMKQQLLAPDAVLTSPAKRTFSTAKIICAAIGMDKRIIQQDRRLYFEGCAQLKTVLSECSMQSKRVLLVGHNPDLEDLLMDLAGDDLPTFDKLLPTAALARLILPDDWRYLDAGCARLESITCAKTLPEM